MIDQDTFETQVREHATDPETFIREWTIWQKDVEGLQYQFTQGTEEYKEKYHFAVKNLTDRMEKLVKQCWPFYYSVEFIQKGSYLSVELTNNKITSVDLLMDRNNV